MLKPMQYIILHIFWHILDAQQVLWLKTPSSIWLRHPTGLWTTGHTSVTRQPGNWCQLPRVKMQLTKVMPSAWYTSFQKGLYWLDNTQWLTRGIAMACKAIPFQYTSSFQQRGRIFSVMVLLHWHWPGNATSCILSRWAKKDKSLLLVQSDAQA